MDNYFGIKVAGWHGAWEPTEGGPEFFCNGHVPDQSEVEEPVFPIFPDDTEWGYQPVCGTCGTALEVTLSPDHVRIPAGV